MHQEVRKMKKVLILSVILLSVLATAGVASAHWRFGFRGAFIAPPVVVAPPYAHYRSYNPAYDHYGYEYPGYGYRRWVPGHWERRWTPYGWKRVWIPGYRQYLR